MQIEDLRRLEQRPVIDTELCVIGSGPAGLTIASEFIGTAVKVLILESGGLVEEPEIDAQSEIESVGAPRIMEPTRVRNRIFGGTSHTWSGRCASFDDIDFETRPWVPFSGWPIRSEDLYSYLDRAATYIGIGPNCYDQRLWTLLGKPQPNPDVNTELLKPFFWQFSKDDTDPLDFMRFGRRFLSSTATNIRILLYATVTHITTNETGSQLVSVEVTNAEGKRVIVRPKALVLCAGGIENARLLLCSNRIVREGVGNQNDVVGRFLMDHPRCTLGEFDLRQSRPIQDRYGLYQLNGEQGGHFFAHGLALSPNFQKKMQLLNCAAWLTDDRADDDPWDAAKRLVSGRDRRHILRDTWYVLSQPRLVFQGLRDRFLRSRGVGHKLRRLLLDCTVEQRPDPASRIRMSDRKDRLGVPLPQLDWRISEQEKATVAIFGQLITDEFKRIGLPPPVLTEWVRSGRYDQAQFVDVAHPAGTTRMARDPREGVVDENCQVHGVDGIFIAGSSVFPTTGHANPTLMIVALAIRLADWLKARQFC